MALFDINSNTPSWNKKFELDVAQNIKALYQSEVRKLLLVPYQNHKGRLVILNYEKDFFVFNVLGSFDITNYTYLWS